MLFDENVEDNEILENWVKEIGISYHEGLILKKTEDRGIGVFLKSNKVKDPSDPTDSNERIELLRCPRKSAFNIYTLREFVSRMDDNGKNIIRKVLGIVFNNFGPSESNIIIAHFIGFAIILEKGIKIGEDIVKYLKILMKTKVGSPYTDQMDALEDFNSDFKGNILMESLINELRNWEIIVKELKEDELNIELNEVLQLCAAIRSRVLEIPRESNDDSEDYYIDVTLVPVIDFVNHDLSKSNAYFDIDKDCKDIILYGEKIKEGEEILIKYDEIEDLHLMFINYGFIPNDENIDKIIEIPILGYNLKENKEDLNNIEISRRLLISGQSPNVQFLIKFNKSGDIKGCDILEEESYSWIVFIESIEWDKWEEEEDNYYGIEENEIFARKYEQCCNVMQELCRESEEQARVKFKAYVSRFMVLFWKRAEMGIGLCLEYERPFGESDNIVQLLEVYAKMGKFCEEHGIGFVKGGVSVDVGSALSHRLRPVYNWESGGGGGCGGGNEINEELQAMHL